MSTVKITRLSDFCATGSGGTPSRSKLERYYEGGTIPWIKSGELRESIIIRAEEYVTDAALKESSIKLVPAGAILLAMYGATVGRLGILGIEATTNQAVCHIVPDPKMAAIRYVYHALSSQVPNLISMGVGGAQPNINQGIIKSLAIPLPPLPEQRRIAAILDQADALRAKRREALAQLDSLEDSIFLEFQLQTKSVSCEMLLKDLAGKTRGAFVNGPFGSDLLTSELQDEGVPVVYIRDIRNGDYQRVSKSCVTENKARDLAVCAVHPGDVLVAKVGDPPGIAAVYPLGEPAAVVTQDVIRIRIDREVALPEFVKAYLNSSLGRWKIAGITVEATRARFSLGDFKKLIVELPPLSLQKEFVARIDGLRNLRSDHQSSLGELDNLFASLQHRAFRGEL